jgi:HK97 family phage portal protein
MRGPVAFVRDILRRREFGLGPWEAWLDRQYTANDDAGVPVTDDSAITWTAVWGCVLVLSQDYAKRPLNTYKRVKYPEGPGREEAREHPLWHTFRVAANRYMTAYTFRQTMMGHIATRGNAYAIIDRSVKGQIQLWPRMPGNMRVEVFAGVPVYIETGKGGQEIFHRYEDVFHVRGFSRDGLTGLSPIEIYREGIGIGLAHQRHASATFKNAARPSLVAGTPNAQLGKEKAQEMAEALKAQLAGPSKSGKILVTWGGMELKPWGFSNKDAEFIDAGHLLVEGACRVWRIPPHKIMDYLRATFSNVTEININHVNDTLRPWDEAWEQEIHHKLLTPAEQATYYVEHDNYDLLKGTPKERAEIEVAYVGSGISKINEVRGSHNWNPVRGGDENRAQMQNVPLGSTGGKDDAARN